VCAGTGLDGQFIEGDVHTCRLPPAPAAETRRRVRAQAKKKGRRAQPRTLALAAWVLVLTTLPPALLSTATAISGVVRWHLKRGSAGLEVMPERPRRRRLQTLPDRVNRLIAFCQANGLSNL